MTVVPSRAPEPQPATVQRVALSRYPGSGAAHDLVAVEAPLEVRLDGQPFSVIMRTPGADRDLALGFLFSEGVAREARDIVRVEAREADQAIDVIFAPGCRAQVAAALADRRAVTTTSSCGLCGRASLASLTVAPPVCALRWRVDTDRIASLPETLRRVQTTFAHTGGLHAAALFDRSGTLLASAEDVGRHNAVDKLVGRMFVEARLPLADALLMVSGRTSFEIVQKAWLAGIPLVAAVSAPSSLAVSLAQEAGITLLGFVRDGRCNVYAHGGRVFERQDNDA